MSLATYADLQTTIAKWVMREGDTTLPTVDFITLAESVIKRRVRRKTVRSQVTFNQESFSLPPDCAELRSVRLNTGLPGTDRPIQIVTPSELADFRTQMTSGGYYPRYAAVIDGQLALVPAPNQALPAEITYFQSLVPLSDSKPTNLLLTEAPDIYLYGACLEAAPYLERDERVATWQQRFDAAIDELNTKREREEYSASVRPMRLPRVF